MNESRAVYVSRINELLTILATHCHFTAKGSQHIDYGPLICGLLNRAFGYNLTVINQNQIKSPNIDLTDPISSVAVQISTVNSRRKVDDAIRVFTEGEPGQRLCDSYKNLIIFIITTTHLRYIPSEGIDFTVQILNIPTLLSNITTLPLEQLTEIAEYLDTELTYVSISTDASQVVFTSANTANLSSFSTDRQQVLRFACFLPQGGLPWELFRQCLSEAYQQTLSLLVGEGFLARQDGCLHLSPEVRRSTLKQLQLTRENTAEFLDRLLQYDRTYFWQHLKFFDRRKVLLQLAKAFSQASEILQDFDGTLALRCAAFYSEVNEISNALQWYLRAVQSCESAPNRDPWNLGHAYLRTAECYQQLNDNTSSLKYCKKLLSLLKRDFRPADPDMARVYYQTGLAQVGLKDHTAALKNLNKAQDYSLNAMTADHPLQSRISNLLSIANKATGNILEAREQKLQSLRESQIRPVTNSAALVQKLEQLEKVQAMPAILRGNKDEILYCEIGDLYHTQRNYVKALEYHMLAVQVRELRPETAPKKLADSYHSIGMIFSDLGDYSEALEYLLKAKEIREGSSGIPVDDQIRSCLDLGAVYSDLGMHQYALEHLTSALKLQKKCLPPQAPELAETYTALGNVCRTLGQDQEALNYFNDAVNVLDTSQLGNRTELAAACMNLANAQIQLTYYRKALHHAHRALDIYTATLPTGHPQRITAKQTVVWLEDMIENN